MGTKDWKVGNIWIFRSCMGVGERRTSYSSVGGRRFSDGVLNSDGSEVDRFPSCGNCSRGLTSMCTWLLR